MSMRKATNDLHSFLVLGLATGLVGMCGMAIHPLVGLPAAAGTFAFWFLRRKRRLLRDWAPDIQGENAYAILGVPQDADVPTIRRAFRRLVRKYHPDGVPAEQRESAVATFIRLSQAYELLTDEEKRFQYDGWIEDLDGNVPPFAEAYERLKDEDKHPIYEIYDELYNPRRFGVDPDSEDEEDHEEEAGSEDDDGAQTQSTRERPTDATDVDIPDAVREALGLPARRAGNSGEPDKSRAASENQGALPCQRCGAPCTAATAGTHILCPKCMAADDTSYQEYRR